MIRFAPKQKSSATVFANWDVSALQRLGRFPRPHHLGRQADKLVPLRLYQAKLPLVNISRVNFDDIPENRLVELAARTKVLVAVWIRFLRQFPSQLDRQKAARPESKSSRDRLRSRLPSEPLRELCRMPRAPRNDISEAIEALYHLNVGVVGTGSERHERPHKPILLLAVMDLIAQGKATPKHIPWSQDLRARFALYFKLIRQLNDQCNPDLPFFYLRQEKWWIPFRQDAKAAVPLETTPTVVQANANLVFAKITEPVANWLITPTDRLCLREALIARYFPHARETLSSHFMESSVQETPREAELDADDTDVRPGRSAGFRRVILDLYDCQCAACGLRIKLPQIEGLTFVDAAHLIPFNDPDLGHNDHPTNGIALCKNHHWAMDRFLIAPSPVGVWKVSGKLVAKRSPGEKELVDLQNQPVLKPSDKAFYPAETALDWRCQRLVA